LSTIIKDISFVPSKDNYLLFTSQRGKSFKILLIYVDDIFITYNDFIVKYTLK
jgi:hypothetical protein